MTNYEVYYMPEVDDVLLLFVVRDIDGRIMYIADRTPNSGHYSELASYEKILVHSWEA